MTTQEAINILRLYTDNLEYPMGDREIEIYRACLIAIELMKKDLRMTPITISKLKTPRCPICKCGVATFDYEMEYCDHCGQHLD